MIDDPDAQIRARLRLIAEALDLPIQHFYAENATRASIEESNECLRLWCRIGTPEGRRRALDALRALVDEEGA